MIAALTSPGSRPLVVPFGAFDVLGGERLAIVPGDALAQWKSQLGSILVPRPTGGEIRHHRLQRVLRHILLEDDEVVEYAHHRPLGEDRRFLVDRHARRAVETVRDLFPFCLLARFMMQRRSSPHSHWSVYVIA